MKICEHSHIYISDTNTQKHPRNIYIYSYDVTQRAAYVQTNTLNTRTSIARIYRNGFLPVYHTKRDPSLGFVGRRPDCGCHAAGKNVYTDNNTQPQTRRSAECFPPILYQGGSRRCDEHGEQLKSNKRVYADKVYDN